MQDKICSKCKTKLSDFEKTSLLGCSYCYTAFREELVPILKKMQGKMEHIGSSPKITEMERELLYEYKKLLSEKENAIISGNFKESVELGEDLSELTVELKKRGLI